MRVLLLLSVIRSILKQTIIIQLFGFYRHNYSKITIILHQKIIQLNTKTIIYDVARCLHFKCMWRNCSITYHTIEIIADSPAYIVFEVGLVVIDFSLQLKLFLCLTLLPDCCDCFLGTEELDVPIPSNSCQRWHCRWRPRREGVWKFPKFAARCWVLVLGWLACRELEATMPPSFPKSVCTGRCSKRFLTRWCWCVAQGAHLLLHTLWLWKRGIGLGPTIAQNYQCQGP